MKFTWLTLAMYALLLQLAPTTMAEEAALLPQGIVAKQPETGLFVATEQGFMVPYRVTIPGTQVEFEMVPIPGGRYSMTRHGRTFTVVIEPFWMAKTEVTWAEYRRYMDLAIVFDKFDDLGIRQVTEANEVDAVTAPSKLYEPSFTFESGDDPDQPAVSMTQYSAKQYTKWLSRLTGQFFRLPSEAEWEYACLAGAETSFSFGDDTATLGDYAWYYDNADYELGAVAQKKPNAWGLCDMHGNAAEWVLDAYDEVGTTPAEGSTVTVAESIVWPDELYPRVLKGGSWQQEALDCTATSRLATDDDEWRINDPSSPQSPWWFASDEGQQVGFRLLRPLGDPSREEKEKYWKADMPRILAHANRRINEEGRGERGLVDAELPSAIESIQQP